MPGAHDAVVGHALGQRADERLRQLAANVGDAPCDLAVRSGDDLAGDRVPARVVEPRTGRGASSCRRARR
jgi:hypothetical protein